MWLVMIGMGLLSVTFVLLHWLRQCARRLLAIGARPTLQNLFLMDELEELYWLDRMEGASNAEPGAPCAGRTLAPGGAEGAESTWGASRTLAS